MSFRRPGITPLAKVSLARGTPATVAVLPGVELEAGVGLLAVPLLGAGAASRIGESIDDLERTGLRGLVLDLRSASSVRDLGEAVRIAGLFLPQGTAVLRIEGRAQSPEVLATDTAPRFADLPLVVVVDSGTADAAEALAGVADGTIDALCSDHTPVDEDAKQLPFSEAEPGATGVELLLPLTLKWAAESKLGLSAALERITVKPASILGIDAGHLAVGAAADICIFDPDAHWRVEPAALYSLGKNTPFSGYELRGRVTHTLVSGTIVYEKK